MNSYSILNQQQYSKGDFSLITIRDEDRFKIMNWRNGQIYHLRQKEILTKEDQEKYFTDIIHPSFKEKYPNQVLFSFLKGDQCIGYGGLVHIDWDNKSAEISFIMDTALENTSFEINWNKFIYLIEKIAFNVLLLKRLTVFSYELRPKLYSVLNSNNYLFDKRIKNHTVFKDELVDALIHYKETNKISFRSLKPSDKFLLFEWYNEKDSLKNSLRNRRIDWDEHVKWFNQKYNDKDTNFFVFQRFFPVGVVRLDHIEETSRISFSVDKDYRGNGIGSQMINVIINLDRKRTYIAEVIESNIASQRIFINNGFKQYKESKVNNLNVKYFKKEKTSD